MGPAATSTVIQIASRPRSRTSAPDIMPPEVGKFCRLSVGVGLMWLMRGFRAGYDCANRHCVNFRTCKCACPATQKLSLSGGHLICRFRLILDSDVHGTMGSFRT